VCAIAWHPLCDAEGRRLTQASLLPLTRDTNAVCRHAFDHFEETHKLVGGRIAVHSFAVVAFEGTEFYAQRLVTSNSKRQLIVRVDDSHVLRPILNLRSLDPSDCHRNVEIGGPVTQSRSQGSVGDLLGLGEAARAKRGPDLPDEPLVVRQPAAPELIEPSWRVVGPSKTPIVCAVYKAPQHRVEVRCCYEDGNIIRTQLVDSMEAARELADAWLQAIREKGSFTDLPIPDGTVQAN